MEKENHSQLELFSQVKNAVNIKIPLSKSFLNYIWGYEKIILTIVGFIITGIVSFSLGVERGRNLTVLKSNSHFDMAAKIRPSPENVIAPKKEERPVIEERDVKTQEYIQGYTIQVASYQTSTHAQKEAEALRKKGFLPLVFAKGKYRVVCVGSFSDKERARSLLSELKKRYRDCYIRRL